MALIKCPECGKEVSDLASTCPNCGFPLERTVAKPESVSNSKPKPNTGKLVLGLLTLILIVVIVSVVVERLIQSSDNKVQPQRVSSNPYVQQWAGYYEIKVLGYTGSDSEKLTLRADGSATWVWVQLDSQGNEVEKSRKYGSWTASVNKITTTFALSSGIEDLVYVYNNGEFEEVENKNRHLKRYKQ